MTNIFKSVIGNIETLNSDIEVRILINGFHIIDAESMIPGYVIQIWSATDDHYPDGRILRQVAFDMDGNPYRFAANCGFTKFAPVPRDGYQYGGFTPLEMIELVRFRDWIISQFPSKGMKTQPTQPKPIPEKVVKEAVKAANEAAAKSKAKTTTTASKTTPKK